MWTRVTTFSMPNGTFPASTEDYHVAQPTRRYCHSTVSVDINKVLVFGGGSSESQDEYLNDMWELNTDTMSWRHIEPATDTIPTGRLGHTAVVSQKTMYVFGGYDGNGLRGELYAFDVEKQQWSLAKPNTISGEQGQPHHPIAMMEYKRLENLLGIKQAPSARSQHSALFYRGVLGSKRLQSSVPCPALCVGSQARWFVSPRVASYMIIFGGYDGDECNDTYAYDIDANEWMKLDTRGKAIPPARYQHQSCLVNYAGTSYMFVYGGFDRQQQCLADIWLLNLDSLEWELIENRGEVPIGRGGHKLVPYDSFVAVFGGEGNDDRRRNDLYIFDMETREWSKLLDQAQPDSLDYQKHPPARYCHSCVSIESTSEIVLFGGRDDDDTLFDDLWIMPLSSLLAYEDDSCFYQSKSDTDSITSSYPASPISAVTPSGNHDSSIPSDEMYYSSYSISSVHSSGAAHNRLPVKAMRMVTVKPQKRKPKTKRMLSKKFGFDLLSLMAQTTELFAPKMSSSTLPSPTKQSTPSSPDMQDISRPASLNFTVLLTHAEDHVAQMEQENLQQSKRASSGKKMVLSARLSTSY